MLIRDRRCAQRRTVLVVRVSSPPAYELRAFGCCTAFSRCPRTPEAYRTWI